MQGSGSYSTYTVRTYALQLYGRTANRLKTGLLTKDKRDDTEGGERNNRCGVQTRIIRPIAFDIKRDVGVTGCGATVPFRNNPHVVPGKDHGCDRSEILASGPRQ